MSETIAITGKSVKLFKGHYTSCAPVQLAATQFTGGLGGAAVTRML
ncbi:MAG: hypothetical protein ACREYE_33660 [Gammaproteobacteria bacterium]